MMTHDYYGAFPDQKATKHQENLSSVDEITNSLSSTLSIEFSGRHSYERNGDYYLHESDDFGTIRVLNNVNEDDPDELPSIRYSNFRVIVSVESPRSPDDIRDRLISLGLTHLERDQSD